MLKRFLQGSIRWQIVTLAVLPIFLVGVLGIMTEPASPEKTELTQAEIAAAQIALVARQVDTAITSDASETVLAIARQAGMEVARVSPVGAPPVEGTDYEIRLLTALENVHGREAVVVDTSDGDLAIVVAVKDGHLSFVPTVMPVPGLNDDVVNIILSVIIIVLPVAFLSIYAARLITLPMTRIAAAADAQNRADPATEMFEEGGPREIRLLAKRLNEMRSQIESMLKERTAMLRAVSHDLRTPLTRLKLRIEQSVEGDPADALQRDVDAINDMINETLSYLRSDAEIEVPRKADLPSLLRTICSDFSDVGYTVSYTGPDRLSLECNPKSLARAVANLVDNGTKFGGSVEVTLKRDLYGAIRIEVADNGPGIPAEIRSRVMEPFEKGDPSRSPSTRSGFGLGLSIVREIMTRHGGTMELAHREPRGLCVALVFPSACRKA
ncbi:sensor histidine kinase [Arenibacterium sp. LLYu02]|uniref:sensor histidine kinase n=1 Tax=Arenibacterium sp. LLYu02 TaxID=3404132 RepID=UPI003B220115